MQEKTMDTEEIEIALMQVQYDCNAWRNQILQNQKRIKEYEKGIRVQRESIKALEAKIREKDEEKAILEKQFLDG